MTAFADMTPAARNGWLLWCQNHDWCAGPEYVAWYDDMTGEMVTYGLLTEYRDGEYRSWVEEARHRTPRDLKAWAGY